MTNLTKWASVLAWMAIIYALSAQPSLPTPEQRWLDALLEKSAHMLEFAVLAALLLRALDARKEGGWRLAITAVLFAWVYALSDEYHQSFVPGRNSTWSDVAFDWTGAVLGVGALLYWWLAQRKRALSKEA